MNTDLSIDLETLGTAPGGVITQIGLCAFDAMDCYGATSSTLIRIKPQTCLDVGMQVKWETIRWWLKQDEAARLHMAEPEGAVHISEALLKVSRWVDDNFIHLDRVWGNGSVFDIGLLEWAYNKLNLDVPWDFRAVRDIRTLVDLKLCAKVERPKPAMAHSAMADAKAQAEWVRLCMRAINAENHLDKS